LHRSNGGEKKGEKSRKKKDGAKFGPKMAEAFPWGEVLRGGRRGG